MKTTILIILTIIYSNCYAHIDYNEFLRIGTTYCICGEKWNKDDPFEKPQDKKYVIIVDKTDGWVQYKYATKNPEYTDLRCTDSFELFFEKVKRCGYLVRNNHSKN